MTRSRIGTHTAVGFLLATLPLIRVAGAQGLTYAYRAGDAALFSETLKLEVTSTGPAGSVLTTLVREARIAFAFVRPDSVRAWYDSLSIQATGPTGTRTINAREALRLPFALSMSPDGIMKTLSIPTFPASLRDLGNFNPQFDDFIPTLPPIGAAPGGTRTDTITHRESQEDNRHSYIRRVVKSRYDRDTTIAGEAAIVISQQSMVHAERTTPIRGGTYTARLVLDGNETGIAIVSRSGKLIHRGRTGETRGSIDYKASGTDVTVPQHYRYRITLNAER